jgi:hypothetical protein
MFETKGLTRVIRTSRMSVNDIREKKNEDEAKYQGSKNEKIRPLLGGVIGKCHLGEKI